MSTGSKIVAYDITRHGSVCRELLSLSFAPTNFPPYACTGKYCSVAARDKFHPFDAAFVMYHKQLIGHMWGLASKRNSLWEATCSCRIV
jgi:hypothetical protein